MAAAVTSSADPWRESLLGDVLGSIRVRSSIVVRPTFRAPWGLSLDANGYRHAAQFHRVRTSSPALVQPLGGRKVAFHIVATGSCCLEVRGDPGHKRLTAGDFVVFPREHPHVLRDQPTTAALDLVQLFDANPPSRNGALFAGGMGPVTKFVCGRMWFDNVKTNPLLAALPPVIHVKGIEEGGAPWLRLTVQHVVDELDSERPGVEAVVCRLADILFIGAVRSYIEQSLATAESGWLAAVRDSQIGRAIALIHADPARPWTVVMLADQVALSRSAFAARFTELVGEPPLRYVTRVRLDVAARRLRETMDKLVRVAADTGYDSAAAFSRAFERHLGLTPGEYRRTRHGS